MKKYSIVLVCLLSVFILKAQSFQGKAEYFVKYNTGFGMLGSDSEVKSEGDAVFNKAVQEAMKKGSEKRFLLSFNKLECLYEEQKELEKPDAASGGDMAVSIDYSDGGKKYLNSKEKTTITERDIFGKEFLVVGKLESLEWKLINETKKIGDYTCLKAEVIIRVPEKEKEEYEAYLKQQEIKASLFKMEEPKDKVVTAWYTSEIPANFGPNNYWGLPGLILEIRDENAVILCSKVVLNNKATSKIKVPNTGKKVTQTEFDTTEKKMYDSMKNNEGNVIFQTKD